MPKNDEVETTQKQEPTNALLAALEKKKEKQRNAQGFDPKWPSGGNNNGGNRKSSGVPTRSEHRSGNR